MKSVSDAYKSSMKQILRNRSFVRITFQNIDTSASSDGEWVDNGHESFSELETLNYERIYGRTFATLELNRWSLDGSLDTYNGQAVTDGFVSSYMSGATSTPCGFGSIHLRESGHGRFGRSITVTIP